MSTKDVTLVIPTVPGREELAHRARETALAQSVPYARILLVEDSDRDGPAVTRNRGLAQVETPLTAVLDDDDFLFPMHNEVLLRTLHPDAVLAYSACWVVDAKGWHEPMWQVNGKPAWRQDFEQVRPTLARRNVIPSAVLFRTEEAKDVGGYPLDMRFEDYGFLKRLLKLGRPFSNTPCQTWVYDTRHPSTQAGAPGRPLPQTDAAAAAA